jgi:glycosyltransferase involved in cell wall biosynthesis
VTGSALKILHVFDHSPPRMSGYSMCSLALLEAQHRLGWQTVHLTTPKHTMPGPTYEEVDGFAFHRTAPVAASLARWSGLNELALMRATARRIRHIASYEKPDIIHAHSPALNAIAAVWAGKKLGIPTVYEIRVFSEDAAVGDGFDSKGSLRCRATRLLDEHAFRKADAIVTICAGLRADIAARGIAAEKISVVPNGIGLFFAADDAKAPARSFDAATTRHAQWPPLHRAGRDFVERERSWDCSVEGYLAAYSRALGHPIVASPPITIRRGKVA